MPSPTSHWGRVSALLPAPPPLLRPREPTRGEGAAQVCFGDSGEEWAFKSALQLTVLHRHASHHALALRL